MRHQTDEQLISQTLAGNQASFTELVRRYQHRVAVTIRSVLGETSRDDLADVAQDIFLLVYRSLGAFRGEAKLGTWITRIALRHCYRESKRRRRRQLLFHPLSSLADRDAHSPALAAPAAEGTDSALDAAERKAAVNAAIGLLPEEFRTVLVLRVVEEMPVEEVAEALGISTGTVKSRLHRAKEKMRELLAGSGLEIEIGQVS